MEETARTEWYCPWCGDNTDFIKAINQDLLHSTDLEKYSQIDWIEREVGYGHRSNDFASNSRGVLGSGVWPQVYFGASPLQNMHWSVEAVTTQPRAIPPQCQPWTR